MRTFARKTNRVNGVGGDKVQAADINELQEALEDLQDGTLTVALGTIGDALGEYDGFDGAGTQEVENLVSAAGGMLLANGQVTFVVFGPDGLPIPASVSLIVEALDRDGITFDGKVTSVNGDEGAVVIDGDDIVALLQAAGYNVAEITDTTIRTLGAVTDWVEVSGALTATSWDTDSFVADDPNNEVVHPSVLYFPDGWGGHTYWAAITPYPGADTAEENPSIFVSDDGITWVEPVGVTNPIIPTPETGYNADPCLVIGPNGLWYLFYRTSSPDPRGLWFVTSEDGITWSEPVLSEDLTAAMTAFSVAPAIWYDAQANEWIMLSCDKEYGGEADEDRIKRQTAQYPDGPWSEAKTVIVDPVWPNPLLQPWHIDAHPVGNGEVWALVSVTEGSLGGYAYLMRSTDAGATFRVSTETFGGQNAYKCAFVPVRTETGIAIKMWIGYRLGGGGPHWIVRYTVAESSVLS